MNTVEDRKRGVGNPLVDLIQPSIVISEHLALLLPQLPAKYKTLTMTQYERIAQFELTLTLRDKRLRRKRIFASAVAMLATATAASLWLIQ